MILVRKIIGFIKWMVVFFFVSSILAVVLYRFVPVYATPLMFIRCYEQIEKNEELKLHHHWVGLDEMSPSMPVAVIASEDQRFMQHHGFDFKEIQKAAKENLSGEKKRIRGGSTISQQTAKNVFLWQGRSWLRKGLEAYFTFLIEMMWSKQRIMEVYLNSIEMGDGIYGIEAAAKHYYGCSASELNKKQAATIVSCFPSPIKRTPDHMTKEALRHRRQILKGMTYLKSVKFD